MCRDEPFLNAKLWAMPKVSSVEISQQQNDDLNFFRTKKIKVGSQNYKQMPLFWHKCNWGLVPKNSTLSGIEVFITLEQCVWNG